MYRRTRGSIYRIVGQMRARQLLERPINYIYNPQFDLPNADEMILPAEPAPPGALVRDDKAAVEPRQIPSDLPAYLRSLQDSPLLTAQVERDLFRKYNYLKCKGDRLRRQLDLMRVRASQIRQVETLLLQANAVKNQIIRANLRLVVSIAKKHAGSRPQSLLELISDGNVTLMRAVEKFDYARGNRFSTYASWAIMRSFARSVSRERSQQDRFVTGHEDLLDAAAALRAYDPDAVNVPELRETIEAMLAQLVPRERTILIDHYGLDESAQPQTLDQLGQKLGISKERVRQIEMQALNKLRRLVRPQAAGQTS
jgi:RNA polymerase primary sigma factor